MLHETWILYIDLRDVRCVNRFLLLLQLIVYHRSCLHNFFTNSFVALTSMLDNYDVMLFNKIDHESNY